MLVWRVLHAACQLVVDQKLRKMIGKVFRRSRVSDKKNPPPIRVRDLVRLGSLFKEGEFVLRWSPQSLKHIPALGCFLHPTSDVGRSAFRELKLLSLKLMSDEVSGRI